MKNKFYCIGTVIGLICVPLVAYAILLDAFFGFFDNKKFLVPVGIGFLASLILAVLLDGFKKPKKQPCLLLNPLIFIMIFLFGAVVGGITNLFLNGEILSPPFGLMEEVWDWLGKPLFWLLAFGIPCAALIGLAYTAVCRWIWAKMG
jgi:hypothetical protein